LELQYFSVNLWHLKAMKKHQTTILDIARELNISKSTVSRALTGHHSINPETKKAVMATADRLDYNRNMLSVSLVSNKSNTIGIIVPEFQTAFFPKVIVGAQEVASKAGYNIIVSQSNESYETEVANTKVMLNYCVDGLIVSITKESLNYEHLKIFQRKGIPIVFFNRVCEDMDVPKVVVNDYDAAFHGVDHLIQTGKKRIAHLAGPNSLAISRKRMNGYLQALKKNNIPVIEELIIPYDLSLEKVKIYVKHLLELKEPPDGLFAINDPTAIEAIKVIKAKGLRIPEDIGVVGFSDDYGSDLIEPGLTTLSQPTHEMGKASMQLLLDQLTREVDDWKTTIKMLEAPLIVRGSTVR
jgi:DNA-binding LacI/PurR family transcriptional regulator